MHKIKVYDRKNPERLLGTMAVRDGQVRTYVSVFSVPVMSVADIRMDMAYLGVGAIPRPDRDLAAQVVDFHLDVRHESHATEDHRFHRTIIRREWTVFLTDAPLALLSKIKGFSIEGEETIRERMMGRY